MVSSLLFWFTTTVSATWYQGKEFGNNEEVDIIIGHRYSWSSIRFFCYVTSPNEEEAMRSESIISTHFYAIKVGGEAPVLLWLLFCLMSQKREHLFIHFYAFSFFNFIHDIHDIFSWNIWKHHFLILLLDFGWWWPGEIIKKIFLFSSF